MRRPGKGKRQCWRALIACCLLAGAGWTSQQVHHCKARQRAQQHLCLRGSQVQRLPGDSMAAFKRGSRPGSMLQAIIRAWLMERGARSNPLCLPTSHRRIVGSVQLTRLAVAWAPQ